MREDVDQLEFERLFAPVLTDDGGAFSTFLSDAINGVEDCDAGEIRVANRIAIAIKFVEGGVDNDFEIPSERFHVFGLILITYFFKNNLSVRSAVTCASMNRTVSIPDDIAERLGASRDLERSALEALALEEYRAGRMTRPELRRMLGFATRPMLDGFLKDHGIDESMTLAEFERQRQDLDRLGL
jgi:hypothetical protein